MESNNEITLVFDKADTRLAGFPYGESVYKEQVEGKLDMSKDITIIFPEQIKRIASSFVQGFFSGIIGSIGYAGFEKSVVVKASSEELVEYIRKNIY